MRRQLLVSLLILLVVTGFATAATITVPGDYLTIQEAIDAAVDGDEVVIDPNTYTGTGNWDIDFLGKAITVRSTDPNDPNVVAATVIDCQGTTWNWRRGFYFHNAEGPDSVLSGLTIMNGMKIYGGGIECENASPTISNCIITNNFADNFGGGVDLYMSSAVIINCQISGNFASEGGGINCDTDDAAGPTIAFCEITGNTSNYLGGGINCFKSSATIKNCLIENNMTNQKAGAVYLWDSGPEISNCTIIDNFDLSSSDFGGIYREGDDGPTIINSILWNNGDDLYKCLGLVSYSCVQDGDPGVGNISDDPLFRTGPLGDYYLSQRAAGQISNSLCLDAGDDSAAAHGLAGYTTATNNTLDIGDVDMGYHYADSGPVVWYNLTTRVDANYPDGSIDPNHPSPGSPYVEFAEVLLTADPCDGYKVKAWTGADDVPATGEVINVVTMNADKTVTVAFEPIPMYTLTTGSGPNGTVEPRRGGSYLEGTVVNLTALPHEGYRVNAWSNTDDDSSTANENTVTMNGPRNVWVTFVEYNTIHVPGAYPYIGLQDAINAAQNGDVIIIAPGTYIGTGYEIRKNITISGSNPQDPEVVAATIIDHLWGQVPWNPQDIYFFKLYGSGGGTCVLNGITMANSSRYWVDGVHGPHPGDNGWSTTSWDGEVGVNIYGNHIIANCIIRNNHLWAGWSGDGADGDPNGYPDPEDANVLPVINPGNGGKGGYARGGGIYISSGSPKILNTTIEGCIIYGARGGTGGIPLDYDPDDPNLPGGHGGHGGDGGDAMGAGVYCRSGTSPTFVDCTIRNNVAYAGDANDGTDGADGNIDEPDPSNPTGGWGGDGGVPGKAYGAGVYCGSGVNATFINCSFSGNQAIGGSGGNGGDAGAVHTAMPWHRGGHGGLYAGSHPPPEEFSARGAGVYLGPWATATFTGCTFSDNETNGSQSGIGGWPSHGRQEDPHAYFHMPSYGAGIYCAYRAVTTFTDCTAQGNIITYDEDNGGDPNITDPEEPNYFIEYVGLDWIGYGAGMCFEGIGGYATSAQLNNCYFTENYAPIGGGVYANKLTTFEINGGDFVDNSAYLGAGLFSIDNVADIVGCTFTGNSAVNPGEGGFGQGGGMFCFADDARITDCVITENSASASGGGLYLSGDADSSADAVLKNCLITGNRAGRDGGGISCDWYIEPTLSNCTIADNMVTGVGFEDSHGGGLYCAYGTEAKVIDSIIWGNMAFNGSQIAISSGGQLYPLPSTLDITYSDIGLSYDPNFDDFDDPNLIPSDVLTVAPTDDANTLVEEILGTGITVSNLSYTGTEVSSGTFRGGIAAGIGIESGIILTTGNATLALPPNVNDAETWDNNLPGDADLDTLIPGYTTYDAIILEFDFTTEGGDLFFNYAFASEEYNEWVNSAYNDVFGFFLDGINIALVPGTTTQVSINNVNGGNPYGQGATNPELFNNNDPDDGGPFFDIEYDGFTNVFTAQALNIGPGTHHIKLAIADAGDHVLDSAVFIESGSFTDIRVFGPPIYIEDANSTIDGWNPNTSSWDPSNHNIDEDPNFIFGYYLSHIAAGQDVDSACIDAGSNLASNLGMDTYNTRADGVGDVNMVDMGYHYSEGIPQYWLNVTVVSGHGTVYPTGGIFYIDEDVLLTATPDSGYRVKEWTVNGEVVAFDGNDPNTITVTMDSNKFVTVEFEAIPVYSLTVDVGPNGSLSGIDPPGGSYLDGTVVTITVDPCEGYRVESWLGTDDDTSTANTNTVTMTEDITVYVTFVQYTTIHVPGNYPYIGIQDALDAVGNGDVIIISPGTYVGTGFEIRKNITIAGSNPDDPNVVAATIIDTSGESTIGFELRGDGGTCVLNGITIANSYRMPLPAADGPEPGVNGYNGYSLGGGGINIYGDHIVANCIIRNCQIFGGLAGSGADGDVGDYPDPGNPNILPVNDGANGGRGGHAYGAGIYIGSGSPQIRNCVIDGCIATSGGGGSGGVGLEATAGDPNLHGGAGGDGGNSGNALGGGIYCNSGTSPTFEDCTIKNCGVYSGDASDGGDGTDGIVDEYDPSNPTGGEGGDGGVPGMARGAGVYCAAEVNATFTNCSFIGNEAYGGNAGDGGDAGAVHPAMPNLRGGLGGLVELSFTKPDSSQGNVPPENYSANGGGACIDSEAAATFTGCTFSDNVTKGSTSGLGGFPSRGGRAQPHKNFNIPSYGAGVYCGDLTATTFTNCTAQGNETTYDEDNGGDPNVTDPEDPNYYVEHTGYDYTGYGGGMCFDGVLGDSTFVQLINCHIAGNNAPVGGGIFGSALSTLDINDCNFVDNSAYLGAGLFSINNVANILGCSISGNIADDPREEVFGYGSGIFCFADDALIADCVITENTASGSGGGVYLSGDARSAADPVLKNCLITDNTAGRDGGGVSCDWYIEPRISNCTIVENRVTGIGFEANYGGGLYCSYGSNTEIIDSIIWGNIASNGSQIAISGGGSAYPLPSTLNITYSDIDLRGPNELGGPEEPEEPELPVEANALPVIRAGFDANSLAANDDLSTGLVDIGFDINFFGTIYSQLYVNNNGNVTFDANMWTFTPFGLTTDIGTSIIAPYFADVDTRTGNITAYGPNTIDGHNAFGVTWVDVGYYSQHLDKLNTFQLILIDRSDRGVGDFDIEFNYEQIEWETGDASGGSSGLGGESAHVGFSNGTGDIGTFYEFEGSGVNGAFLDSDANDGLIYGSRNSKVDGRYIFSVETGIPVTGDGEEGPAGIGRPIYIEDANSTIYGWNPDTNSWDPNNHNISEDPNFVFGYYLSHIAAGQNVNSLCIDVGSDLASNLGLDTYNTRVDGVNDVDTVDMGYHYSQGATQYQLTVTIIEDLNDPGIHGTVYPTGGLFYEGDDVLLTATPDSSYRVREWTVDGNAVALDANDPNAFTVTMDSDKAVTLAFEVHPMYRLTTVVVGGNGSIVPNYPSPGVPYPDDAVILLTATPAAGYEVKFWSGTDNDLSREPNNTVTITDSDAYVTVEFGLIGYSDITINGDTSRFFVTIQAAIDAAEAGDEVIVGDGTYTGPGNRNLHFNGVPITVRSENGPTNCIIDCEGMGRGFRFSAYVDGVLDANGVPDSNYIVRGFTITNGLAAIGGGLYYEGITTEVGGEAEWFPAPLVDNCVIIGNSALTIGGGVCFNVTVVPSAPGAPTVPLVPTITNCKIINNTTSLSPGANGGGIFCTTVSPIIIGTEISGNSGYKGGGIYCEGEAAAPAIINCLVTYNTSVDIGGAIYLLGSSPTINLCTIAYNYGLDYNDVDPQNDDRPYGPKGGICALDSSPEISNCIIGRSGSTNPDFGTWGDGLTYGDDLYGCSATYSCIENLVDSDEDDGEGNISDDPLWIRGSLGNFYLMQFLVVGGLDSPCKDAGEEDILTILQGPPPDGYNLPYDITTSILNDYDIGYADMGYHYPPYDGPPIMYELEIIVIGNGTVSPSQGVYYYTPGTVVYLQAFVAPDHWGYWSGTDDDTSFNTWNTVSMYGDRSVTVSFEPIEGNTLYVPDEYPLLQDAIDAAKYKDTIELSVGGSPYRTSQGFFISNNKAITIRSTLPDDPCCVAATVIEMEVPVSGGYVQRAFTFYNVGPNTVLNGITIRGFDIYALNGIDGEIAPDPGFNGGNAIGSAILCVSASPTIRNCIITDCNATGGDGGDGLAGTSEHPDGGEGGWPGRGYGGGMASLYDSNPTVINCTFNNCAAVGGNGGDGGNGSNPPTWGKGGRGGGWFYGENSYWYNVPWPYAYHLYDGSPGFYDFYTEHGGRGGAVYVGEGCSPTFIDCTFTNNRSEGGFSGICGQDGDPPALREEPGLRWKIDNFGGAAFCDADSSAVFENCTFNNNIADSNRPIRDYSEPYDAETNYDNDDSVVGFGGAVAFKYNADITFNNCTFNNNSADEGGGMYWAHSDPLIGDCSFVGNSAYAGGAVLFVGGSSEIMRSDFVGNEAARVFARGGAICSLGANALIADCNISSNNADGSGGGIYISSKDIDGTHISDDDTMLVRNCLITNNTAGRDGGGISTNWGSEPNIVNCTIADNRVTAIGFETGYGGGLYCSYSSDAEVIDSIIWGNRGPNGSQIAIGGSSALNITYSDIDLREPNELEEPNEPTGIGQPIDADAVPVIRPGFDDNSLAANDDDSTGLIDIGFDINFFGTVYSQLYVNNNGNVTFDSSLFTFTPFGLTGNIGTSIIAPYFADVDTRTGNITAYGPNTIDGHNAFGVTWVDVGYYSQHLDKLNTFQLIFIDRSDRGPGDFDIEFNYEQIEWETGDASDGSNGFGGNSARVGFSNGTGDIGTFYEFEGSGVNGAFLDSNPATGLIHDSGNSAVSGRYIFSVENGVPGPLTDGGAAAATGPPIYIEDAESTINWWNPDTNSWDPGSHNIDEDPNFIFGYYLSHIAAGQNVNSLCIDAGSNLAANVGMDTYTTRVDGVNDADMVDMGYHYSHGVAQYQLTVTIIEDTNDPGIHGTVYPTGGIFYVGSDVLLTATPDSGYRVREWTVNGEAVVLDANDPNTITVTMDSDKAVTVQFEVYPTYQLTVTVVGGSGTVDPNSGTFYEGSIVLLTATPGDNYRVREWTVNGSPIPLDVDNPDTYTVTMDSDKDITVEFEQPQTFIVDVGGGEQGYYTSVQDALHDAREDDTIVVHPGTYYGGYLAEAIVVDKSVTIRSLNPDDLTCVAATIIDGYNQSQFNEGYNNLGFAFLSDAVLDGFTIQNCGGYWGTGLDGTRTDPNHPDGWEGGMGSGAAIRISSGVSVTIKNCIIKDNIVIGGDGGDGSSAGAEYNAGRGGWGGWAYGGAVYCLPDSNATFIKCQIIDNEARGGNGGDGGDDADPGGMENYGGNWSMAEVLNIDPFSLDVTFIQSDLWEVWGYIGDYRWYTAYGGGVFCGRGSEISFIDCTISENRTYGGVSGQGGENIVGRPIEPLIPYELPSFGGGVYCAAGSTVAFTDCTITDNIASEPNLNNHHLDPYLGHGGGVCAENTATLEFTDCIFSENEASTGGGLHFADANASIVDSNFTFNSAYQGGGVFGEHGLATIMGCKIINNSAVVDELIEPNDPNVAVLCSGGGLHLWIMDMNIIDCEISTNQASASGGGAYFGGEGTSFLTNCLLTNNTARRDGGGVSNNLSSQLMIANCTIVTNRVTGFDFPAKYGGGLYCYDESNTDIIDSILWGNSGEFGSQIAIEGGPAGPATVSVTTSDVQGAQSAAYVGNGCTLDWDPNNLYTGPLFVTGPLGGYYLSQTDTGDPDQTSDSPCVDAGSDLASRLGMNRYTTRTDEVFDRSIVDMGYHYPFTWMAEPCRFCDLLFDHFINFGDFAMLALHWLEEGCSADNDWCQGADITFDTYVDFEDLDFLIECWLVEDVCAPLPNPSEWEIEPYLSSATSISMTTKTVADTWGGDVEYYFECTYGDCHDRDWDPDATYTEHNLDTETEYGYRVRARDGSSRIPDDGTAEPGNKTTWSVVRYAITSGAETGDYTPPTPDPMISSYSATSSSIALFATVVNDDTSGVEYYFENFYAPAYNSDWIGVPTWTNTGLTSDTTYTYRVRARDTSVNQNQTGWSAVFDATTLEEGQDPNETDPNEPEDTTPPAPVRWDPNAPNGGEPYETGSGFSAWAHMTADEATDPEGSGVEYYFECVDASAFSSSWTTELQWDVFLGAALRGYRFRFRVRDSVGNVSSWSTTVPCYPP